MGDAPPEGFGVFGGLERRVSVVLHAVLFLVVLGVEAAIIVQGLAVDGEPLGAGLADGVDAFGGGHVDEVDRGAGPFGDADDPAEGNVLGLVAVDQVHVPPLVLLFAGQLLVHVLDHVVVLGVDHEHSVVALDDLH